jgi:hypothetical protein
MQGDKLGDYCRVQASYGSGCEQWRWEYVFTLRGDFEGKAIRNYWLTEDAE